MNVTKEYAKEVYDALILCWEMWAEMAETIGSKTGTGNPTHKWYTSVYQKTGLTCSACSFYSDHHHQLYPYHQLYPCQKYCILSELWPNKCTRQPSPYFSWHKYHGTRADALKIAEFAKEKANRIAKKWGF